MAQTQEDCLFISIEPETKTDEKFAGPEPILIAVIILAIAPIIVIPILPPMLAVYYIALIVQAFRPDVDKQVGGFLGSVAKWLCIFFAVISVDLLLCMLIFGVTPSLKHLTFHGVSIARWIGVLDIICVFLTCCMFVRYLLDYRRLQRLKQSEEAVHLYEGIIGAINSLFYLLALFSIIRVAPLLKEHTVLGHPTQKWVREIILVVLGHFAVRILTSSVVVLFCLLKSVKAVKAITESPSLVWTRYIIYYAEGLRWSINFVLTSLLALLTWILYFGSHLNRSSSHSIIREVYDFGFWTFFCILVSAFVLLVKRGIFLTWEARIVHGRFCETTLCAAKKLCFIGMIAGKFKRSSGPFVNFSGPTIDFSGLMDILKRNVEEEKEGKKRQKSCATEKKKHDILPCAYDAKIMTRYLLEAEQHFSKVGYAPDFVQKWRREILKKRRREPKNERDKTPIENGTLNWYGQKIEGDNLELFDTLLKLFETLRTKDGLNIDGYFEKWIEIFLRQCLDHGRILAGELEWVHCLNNIMTAVLFGAVMIVWLFLTGIATTKVVVLTASPILAASFIFGESCKNFYQGIMFTYVKRPFEVGQICTIDGTQVKILKIGIRRTICSRVKETTDEVIYPNTMLATVPIVKHNGKQDPKQGSDHMELRIDPATNMEKIQHLTSQINTYLGHNQDGFKEHPPGVLTKDTGNTYKIEVHFEYDMPTIGSLDEKRDKFLEQMKKLLNELHIEEITGPCPIT